MMSSNPFHHKGGYNLTSISESMSMCTSMLLGDSPPPLDHLPPPKTSAAVTINNVLRAHAPFWSSLRIQSELVTQSVLHIKN